MFSGIRKPKNTAVFISGGGSTLQALLEMQFQLNIRLVVSNNHQNLGQLKAKRFGLETYYFDKNKSYIDLSNFLKSKDIDQIFLAGYMRLLPEDFVKLWENKIFNIHPSILPDFPGLDASRKSYQAGHDMGVTVHTVTAEMDTGPVILQQVAVSAKYVTQMDLTEAQFLLRRTEQHLLREFAFKRAI